VSGFSSLKPGPNQNGLCSGQYLSLSAAQPLIGLMKNPAFGQPHITNKHHDHPPSPRFLVTADR
jgi:hypothetical protein